MYANETCKDVCSAVSYNRKNKNKTKNSPNDHTGEINFVYLYAREYYTRDESESSSTTCSTWKNYANIVLSQRTQTTEYTQYSFIYTHFQTDKS